jgi:DNA modification methylase
MGLGYSTGNKNVTLYDDNDGKGPYTLVNVKDWWTDIGMIATSKGRLYATQKPEDLLKRIILSSSNKNDLVMDCFCGSGTLLVVAKKYGRRFIGCDINPKAIKISNQRLKQTNLNAFSDTTETLNESPSLNRNLTEDFSKKSSQIPATQELRQTAYIKRNIKKSLRK